MTETTEREPYDGGPTHCPWCGLEAEDFKGEEENQTEHLCENGHVWDPMTRLSPEDAAPSWPPPESFARHFAGLLEKLPPEKAAFARTLPAPGSCVRLEGRHLGLYGYVLDPCPDSECSCGGWLVGVLIPDHREGDGAEVFVEGIPGGVRIGGEVHLKLEPCGCGGWRAPSDQRMKARMLVNHASTRTEQ